MHIKQTFILFTVLLLVTFCSAQDIDELAKSYRLDYAVPEHPAFNILEKNPEQVMRPNNSREMFSLIYSNFTSGRIPIIPKDFSMEISPVFLGGSGQIKLDDYIGNRGLQILYNMKISLATKLSTSADTLRNVAGGLRITWYDQTDLANDKEYIKKAFGYLKNWSDDKTKFTENLIKKGEKYNGKAITLEAMAADAKVSEYVDKLYEEYIKESGSDKSLKKLRADYKNKTWNRLKIETAMALRGSSPDSAVKNLHYTKFAIWNTIAFPFNGNKAEGKSVGQGILTLQYSNERFDTIYYVADTARTRTYFKDNLTISNRYYLGINMVKGFAEWNFTMNTQKDKKVGLNAGIECNLTDGLWLIAGIGLGWFKEHKTEAVPEPKWTNTLSWNINFRFHIPEKKKV